MNYALKELIKKDYLRYNSNFSKLNVFKHLLTNSPFRYSTLLRMCKFYDDNHKKFKFIFTRIIFKMLYLNSSIEIPYTTTIGKGFYMGHFSGITINPKAIIGENVNIHKGVTIGQENRGSRVGTPTIGNTVWIGVNSTIVGNINIGNNVLIAPNSFINFDVPSNSIVVGKKIKSDFNATDGYINNLI